MICCAIPCITAAAPSREMRSNAAAVPRRSVLFLCVACQFFAQPLRFSAVQCRCNSTKRIDKRSRCIADLRSASPLLGFAAQCHCQKTLRYAMAARGRDPLFRCDDAQCFASPPPCSALLSNAFAPLRRAFRRLSGAVQSCATAESCLAMPWLYLAFPFFAMARNSRVLLCLGFSLPCYSAAESS